MSETLGISFQEHCAEVSMDILTERHGAELPAMRMVIVATPRRAQNTKIDNPAGDLGVISPVSSP